MPKTPEKSDILKEARLSLKNPVGYCGHQKFDSTGSVNGALELLEKYNVKKNR